MPHDPVKLADTQAWLKKAKDDLRGAEIDLGAVPPLLGDVMFHCQQAVEKALKAFLTWHDHPFRKTHDLVEVGTQCATLDPSLEDLLRHSRNTPGSSAIPAMPKSRRRPRQKRPWSWRENV